MFKFFVFNLLLISLTISSINFVPVLAAAQALTSKETLLVSDYMRPEPSCESSKLLLWANNDATKKDVVDNIVHKDWFCIPDRETLEKVCTYTILDNYEAKKDSIEYTAKDTAVTSFEIPDSDKYIASGKNYLISGTGENYYRCIAPGATNENESIFNDGSYKRNFDIFSPENYDKYTAPIKNKFADIRCENYKLLVYFDSPLEEDTGDTIDTKNSLSRLDCKTLPEIEKVCAIDIKIDNKESVSSLYFVPSNFEVTDKEKQIKPNFYPGKETRDYFECGNHNVEEKATIAETSKTPENKQATTSSVTDQNPLFLGLIIFSGLMNVFLVVYIVKK